MTQTELIKRHLLLIGPLTPAEAWTQYGCTRLAARIDELRREGMSISTEMVKRGKKRWARYHVCGPVQRSIFDGEAIRC